jgi:ATP-binding cassette, subfamily G (WHITE), eye pigment precursor transporter
MGASGAGKTSLLNVLSDRVSVKKGDSLTGEIKLNDRYELNQQTFGKFGNYVMQDDILFKYFTVKEALTFAARLKLKCSEAVQDRRVAELIFELGLTECQDTPIGDPIAKTISGGERKRTSIGVELVTDPTIVLLDEPTSGLDSFTAVKIVQVLHYLAHKYNKTICSTIH